MYIVKVVIYQASTYRYFHLSAIFQMVFATVYCTITFVMTEQPAEMNRYLRYLLVYVLTTIAADAFGVFLGTLVNPVVCIINRRLSGRPDSECLIRRQP